MFVRCRHIPGLCRDHQQIKQGHIGYLMTNRDSRQRVPIQELIEGSSLGTDGARSIRNRTSPVEAEVTRQIASLLTMISQHGEVRDWLQLGTLLLENRRYPAAAQLYRVLGTTSLNELADGCDRVGERDAARMWRKRAQTILRKGDRDDAPFRNVKVRLPAGSADRDLAAQYRAVCFEALNRLSTVYAEAGVDREARLWSDRARMVWTMNYDAELARAIEQPDPELSDPSSRNTRADLDPDHGVSRSDQTCPVTARERDADGSR